MHAMGLLHSPTKSENVTVWFVELTAIWRALYTFRHIWGNSNRRLVRDDETYTEQHGDVDFFFLEGGLLGSMWCCCELRAYVSDVTEVIFDWVVEPTSKLSKIRKKPENSPWRYELRTKFGTWRRGSWSRVGPYRFCSDGNPMTLSILLWSYLILSGTHFTRSNMHGWKVWGLLSSCNHSFQK